MGAGAVLKPSGSSGIGEVLSERSLRRVELIADLCIPGVAARQSGNLLGPRQRTVGFSGGDDGAGQGLGREMCERVWIDGGDGRIADSRRNFWSSIKFSITTF